MNKPPAEARAGSARQGGGSSQLRCDEGGREGLPLNVADVLAGKRILFIGSTGFVGKVALSLLLRRYPGVGKVFVMVRPGAGSTAEDRFFRKVARSPVFDPIREVYGEGTDGFLRDKCEVIPGDVTRDDLGLPPDLLARFRHEGIDVLVNCAGLVSFSPSLETALNINTLGPQRVTKLAAEVRGGVVHISTCFVAGNRSGDVWEDEPLIGYHPKRGDVDGRWNEDFSPEGEIADCRRIIEQVRARAEDHAHATALRELARKRLLDEGRDPDDEKNVRLAVARERKLWVSRQLTEAGMERGRHWGWPNIYTYSKSLGDQIVALEAERQGVCYALVRPAIVESALRYPFPGWNEGFTTTAPLIYLSLKGHRTYPAGENTVLDIIPVDLVASGIVMAVAAVAGKIAKPVYQLCSGDKNPLYVPRAVELTGLYKRRHFRNRAQGWKPVNRLKSRMETIAASGERFEQTSAPILAAAARSAIRVIEENRPRWGAPQLTNTMEWVRDRLSVVEELTSKTAELFRLFMPFMYDQELAFRADHVRALHASLAPEDRLALPWDPETIDWRRYFLEIHTPGLERWVFPNLEEEFQAKPKAAYTYKDLLELFDATTKKNKRRVAMRMILDPEDEAGGAGDSQDEREPGRKLRLTYSDLQELATRAAESLRALGAGEGGPAASKVLLMSENRPEWAVTYFGALKANAACVPVDHQLSAEEVVNLLRSSRAQVAVLSPRVRERLENLSERLRAAELDVKLLGFDDLLGARRRLPAPAGTSTALAVTPKGEDMASLIFTSGTTGQPKGVMLTHRNFASLVSKLGPVFDVTPRDGLLSVLPLHHTFEFTAGLLTPLMRGAQISYIEELTPEALSHALETGYVTAMVGVPALWQLLWRRITSEMRDRGPIVQWAFEGLRALNGRVRNETPLNLGRALFWPVHRKLGGRIRMLVSGGSALQHDVQKAFHGMGFTLLEGYGLTEASPVLTVTRPSNKLLGGTVGQAVSGVEIRIDDPDANGVGEVIASGPNIMAGYYENPDATAEVLKDGWLHTGDLGRIDEDGRLAIVGRKKDVIIDANGKNVYPDELEELYRDSPFVKELSVVGLPEENGGEKIACLAVPSYDRDPSLSREEVRARVQQHFRDVSGRLPFYKRIKVFHLWEGELPKTATRKVKRKLVVEELERLQRVASTVTEARREGKSDAAGGTGWLLDLVAQVAQKPRERVTLPTRLQELGFDSLMYTELGVALDEAGIALPQAEDLTGVATIEELVKVVLQHQRRGGLVRAAAPKPARRPIGVRYDENAERRAKDEEGDPAAVHVPAPVQRAGRKVLGTAQRMTYETLFDTRVTGRAYVPHHSNFIVAANHQSHLDMGLVKFALGEYGDDIVSLAAKDYFFDDPVKRTYFENFTNLVPMERHGSFKESLKLAGDILRQGHNLLLFPEGTRSVTGQMADFKPALGYLAITFGIDVLPIYLEGTYDALPKGALWPRRRDIAAHIGPAITAEELRRKTDGMTRQEAYRTASLIVEKAVCALRDRGPLVEPPATPAKAKPARLPRAKEASE